MRMNEWASESREAALDDKLVREREREQNNHDGGSDDDDGDGDDDNNDEDDDDVQCLLKKDGRME